MTAEEYIRELFGSAQYHRKQGAWNRVAISAALTLGALGAYGGGDASVLSDEMLLINDTASALLAEAQDRMNGIRTKDPDGDIINGRLTAAAFMAVSRAETYILKARYVRARDEACEAAALLRFAFPKIQEVDPDNANGYPDVARQLWARLAAVNQTAGIAISSIGNHAPELS